MNRRVVVSIANLCVIAVAFVILIEYPQYADYAFYFLILWMVVGFVLLYSMRPSVPTPSANPSAEPSPFPSNAPVSAPLPSGSSSGSTIGFCIYCAAPVSPGARACPACGHALPGW